MARKTMARRLHASVILITGASSGIGRSTAWEFARTVASEDLSLWLILTARRIDLLRKLAEEIVEECGDNIHIMPVELDVTDREAVGRFVDELQGDWREVSVLINNAGLVKGIDQAPGIRGRDIDTMISTNLTGLINMTQAILPIFKERSNGGSGDIINVGSIAGREAYVGGSVYCATKAAVRSFTDALRRELVATRVRVMEVDPGQVETEFSLVRFNGDKEKADAVYQHFEPLTPEDIAEVIVFAASRRENVVLADTLVFPNQQAGTGSAMYKKPSV